MATATGLSVPTFPKAVYHPSTEEVVLDSAKHFRWDTPSNDELAIPRYPAAAHLTKSRYTNIVGTSTCKRHNNHLNASSTTAHPSSPASSDSTCSSKHIETTKSSRGCLPGFSEIVKFTSLATIDLADPSKIIAKPEFEHGSATEREMGSLNIHVRVRQRWYHHLHYEHASNGKARLRGTHGGNMGCAVM